MVTASVIFGLALVGYMAMQDMGGWDNLMAKTDVALLASNKDQTEKKVK